MTEVCKIDLDIATMIRPSHSCRIYFDAGSILLIWSGRRVVLGLRLSPRVTILTKASDVTSPPLMFLLVLYISGGDAGMVCPSETVVGVDMDTATLLETGMKLTCYVVKECAPLRRRWVNWANRGGWSRLYDISAWLLVVSSLAKSNKWLQLDTGSSLVM